MASRTQRSGGVRRTFAAVALLALGKAAYADTALFVETARGRYLRSTDGDLSLSAAANAAATAALLRLKAPQAVDADAAAQVNALLSPDVLDRPSALLSVQLHGVPAGASVAGAEFGAPVSSRELTGGSAAVAAALAPLPGTPLAQQCAAACDAACLSAALGQALPAALSADDAALSALASELACLLAGVRDAAAQAQTQQLLTARLSAYAGVAEAHGAGSEVEAAAAQLLAATLSAALQALQKAHDGAAALHVVLLEGAAPIEQAAGAARRKLLQAAATRDVNAWYSKVAAFGVGILLLVAIVGTVVALCTLPTGTDTLLYARTKSD